MSYNISSWKIKKLDSLAIPVKALCEGNNYFDAPRLDISTGIYTIPGMDGTEIIGRIDGPMIHVSDITCYGEGSGSAYGVLFDALKQSTGMLTVSCVWEGGDSITRLTVVNGDVTEEDIEL